MKVSNHQQFGYVRRVRTIDKIQPSLPISFGYFEKSLATFVAQAASTSGFNVWATECERPGKVEVFSGEGDINHAPFWREFKRLQGEDK